jgi:hypothetical protein
MKTIGTALSLLLMLAIAGPAYADGEAIAPEADQAMKKDYGFVEAFGAFGMQFGEQQYLPTGTGTTYKHPLTNGFAGGVTAGWEFISGLALIGNWEYAAASSREGQVQNALAAVEGSISYHIIAAGLRWTRHLGPGRLYGELSAGVILPFETHLDYTYASAMGGLPTPITGNGAKIDEYNLGFGAYGQLGYQWDITSKLYLATALRVKSFQSDNDGKQTRYENFVPNFAAPQAINMSTTYGTSGANPPTTYSVQDLRLQMALGFRL